MNIAYPQYNGHMTVSDYPCPTCGKRYQLSKAEANGEVVQPARTHDCRPQGYDDQHEWDVFRYRHGIPLTTRSG